MIRTATVLGLVLLLTACSSPSQPSGVSGRPITLAPGSAGAPSEIPATKQPASQPVSPGRDAARLAAFHAHVLVSIGTLGTLLSALETGVAINDTAAIATAAANVQTWSKVEADWLAANPLADCYGAAHTLWDNVRIHAAKAATTAVAGAFDQMEATFATNSAKQVAVLVGVADC